MRHWSRRRVTGAAVAASAGAPFAFFSPTPARAQEATSWVEYRRPYLVRANPGAIFSSTMILDYLRGFSNQTEVMVYGSHYVQEVSPHAIGRALAEWIGALA